MVTILPLITRELRVRSRQRSFYWLRFGIPLVGILFLVPAMLSVEHGRPSRASAIAFDTLVFGLFFLCSWAGLLTASAIINERRDGTLGLLFLTKVNAFDVMIGAFGSAGLFSFCALMSFAPLIMLPVLGGGVSGSEAFRKTLVLLDVLLLALAFGLWTPSRGYPRLNHSWIAVLLFWLFICIFPISPALALLNASDTHYHSARNWFWISLAFDALLAAALFLHASVCLRRSVHESCPTDPAFTPVSTATWYTPWLTHPVGAISDPVYYLVLRQKTILRALWFGAFLGFAWRGGMYFIRLFTRHSFVYSWWGLGLVFTILQTSIFAWAGSRFFLETRRTGALEILLTTPFGAKTILDGQWRALRKLMLGPLLLLVSPVLLRLAFSAFVTPFSSFPSGWKAYWLATVISLLLDAASVALAFIAVLWVSIVYGLRAKSTAAAIICTVLITRAAPYLILMSASFFQHLAPALLQPISGFGVWINVFLQLAAIGVYSLLILWARRSLAVDLSLAAPTQFRMRRQSAGSER
jgi:hypothetical protein